jgi:branched-subunit amino acid transport protein
LNRETDLWTIAVILGLAAVTVLARCFFFILDRPWSLPPWAQQALNYAPIAALAGVVLPEVVMANGQLIATWQDARVFAALTAVAVYYWRKSALLSLLGGMAVYLPLHIGLGW